MAENHKFAEKNYTSKKLKNSKYDISTAEIYTKTDHGKNAERQRRNPETTKRNMT